MRIGIVALAIIAVGVLIVAYSSAFILNPTQQALVLEFGQVKRAIREPGLYFKTPLIQDVRVLDKRILDLNVPAQEIIASDQKRLVVDAFARYRIQDPLRFYQSVQTIEVGASRLSTFVQSALRAVLADASFQDIVRDDRPDLMERIRQTVERNAGNIGLEVVDVRIRRADLPEANSQAIYARMQTERQQEATQIRARGAEAAQRIRASADRTGVVIRAEADRESEQVRGDGDARRNEIFAAAFQRDPEFFSFYRSMQAYEKGLRAQDTSMVISPNTDFFRYFHDPMGAQRAAEAAAAASGQPRGPAAATEGEPQAGLAAPDAAGEATGAAASDADSGNGAAASTGTQRSLFGDAAPADGDTVPDTSAEPAGTVGGAATATDGAASDATSSSAAPADGAATTGTGDTAPETQPDVTIVPPAEQPSAPASGSAGDQSSVIPFDAVEPAGQRLADSFTSPARRAASTRDAPVDEAA